MVRPYENLGGGGRGNPRGHHLRGVARNRTKIRLKPISSLLGPRQGTSSLAKVKKRADVIEIGIACYMSRSGERKGSDLQKGKKRPAGERWSICNGQ